MTQISLNFFYLFCLFVSFAEFNQAHARVFQMGEEPFAAYFKLGGQTAYGLSDSFTHSSGQDTVFSGTGAYNLTGGELGWTIQAGKVGIKLGGLFLQSGNIQSGGANAAGAELFDLSTAMSAVAPVFGVDLNLYRTQETRFYMELSFGQATVNLRNTYTLTALGQTELGVTQASATEVGQTVSVPIMEISMAHEFLLADRTTMALELGYRQLQLPSISATGDFESPTGNRTEGEELTRHSGNSRAVDLSGLTLNLSFRIYLGL